MKLPQNQAELPFLAILDTFRVMSSGGLASCCPLAWSSHASVPGHNYLSVPPTLLPGPQQAFLKLSPTVLRWALLQGSPYCVLGFCSDPGAKQTHSGAFERGLQTGLCRAWPSTSPCCELFGADVWPAVTLTGRKPKAVLSAVLATSAPLYPKARGPGPNTGCVQAPYAVLTETWALHSTVRPSLWGNYVVSRTRFCCGPFVLSRYAFPRSFLVSSDLSLQGLLDDLPDIFQCHSPPATVSFPPSTASSGSITPFYFSGTLHENRAQKPSPIHFLGEHLKRVVFTVPHYIAQAGPALSIFPNSTWCLSSGPPNILH